jgi:leucyl-tRNA synthetase
VLERFAVMLAPVAPHFGEECWQIIGKEKSLFQNPVNFEPDENALVEDSVNIAVQVNGKLRATVAVPINCEELNVKQAAYEDEHVKKHIAGKVIVKEIFVKNKILNIVVK